MANHPFIVAGTIMTGAGMILAGIHEVAQSRQPRIRAAGAPRGFGGVLSTSKLISVRDLNDRARVIGGLLVEGSRDPAVRERAVEMVTRRCGEDWCIQERDWVGEVVALFDGLRKPTSSTAMRYTLDHLLWDTYTRAGKNLQLHAGDCDDQTLVLGAELLSIGHPVIMRIVHTVGSPTWNHIYLLTGLPPENPDYWVALDPTVPQPAGWEVPAHSILDVRDYSVDRA